MRLARFPGLVFLLSLLGAIALAVAAQALTAAPEGTPQGDPHDAQGPLDLVQADLRQRDVRMILRIATSGAWDPEDLAAQRGRSICVTLVQPGRPRGRICLVVAGGRMTLRYSPLAADGTREPSRMLAARVQHPSRGVLRASFLPVAAGLSVGPYAWWVQTTWTDSDACGSTCVDRLPDGDGVVASNLALLGEPACFGAAARDPARPCVNPDLRLVVRPSPEHPDAILDPYCDARSITPLRVCEFGAPPGEAAKTFALIGDSHAAALKTALEVVTLANRWRGVSLVRSACPPTQARRPVLPTGGRSRQCAAWNRRVLAWLADHPGIDTAFIAAHGTSKVRPGPGQSASEALSAGYRAEIGLLLRRVKHVFVIRDTPSDTADHLGCVAHAEKTLRAPGVTCARSRRLAIGPDPLTATARGLHSPRVRVIDLIPRFCSAEQCFPVVGGALVHRDETHLTPSFSGTLGPVILRALGR